MISPPVLIRVLEMHIQGGFGMTPTAVLVNEASTSSADVQFAVPSSGRPTRTEVLDVIIIEAAALGVDCNEVTAARVYDMLYRAVKQIRTGRYHGVYHLSDHDLCQVHDVIDVIMVDDETKPQDGTAHDVIHHHFLHPGEFALVHTKTGPNLEYCAVALELRST
jgi:hypothetical protein